MGELKIRELGVYSISLRSLKTEMKYLKALSFWANSHYWTTRQAGARRKKENTGVKIAYLEKFNWYAFVFSKFHPSSLAVFQELPTQDAYFYKEVMGYRSNFAAWCIDGKHFDDVLRQLKEMPDIEIEFVVKDSGKGLELPKPFQAMGIRFYERGYNEDRQKWTALF